MATTNGVNGASNARSNGAQQPGAAVGGHGVALDPDQYDEFRQQLESESDETAQKLAAYFADGIVANR
jgi:hypothetical protein